MTVLYVYITGPFGSGKTQLLQSLSGEAEITIDESTGTESFQFTVDDALQLCLFCSVDATRFDQLLQIAQRDLLGYIVMVDSTDFDSWSMARVMMANCRGYALLPTLIVANKQDIAGAHSQEQVGGWIGMDSMVQVYGGVAANPTSAREIFLQFLYMVKFEIDRLDALIEQIEKLTAQDASS